VVRSEPGEREPLSSQFGLLSCPRDRKGMSRVAAFRTALVILASLAAAKLADELLRLAWRSGPTAAIDLELRYAEVQAWFAGARVYETMRAAVYPPATYPLLWPFLGWLDLEPARWLWAAATALALAVTVWIAVRESGAGAWDRRAFAGLLVLAPNETGVALGNGQLIPLVLPALLAGLLLMHRGRGSWPKDVGAAACMIFALVKVTLAVPFLWVVLLAAAPDEPTAARSLRLRPVALIAAGYAALTWFALAFQPAPWGAHLRAWLRLARDVAVKGGNYADVHAWLAAAGLPSLILPASAALFLALGVWMFAHRHVDLWLRLGVTALVARFWTYHRLYDDMLVVIALLALLRMTGLSDSLAQRRLAGVLLAITLSTMLLPARLGTAPLSWRLVFTGGHTLAWLAVLGYLIAAARTAPRQMDA